MAKDQHPPPPLLNRWVMIQLGVTVFAIKVVSLLWRADRPWWEIAAKVGLAIVWLACIIAMNWRRRTKDDRRQEENSN